jgi:hypothetical protein
MFLLANIGVPMLPVQGLFMAVSLVPIILIEAVIIRKRQSLPFKRSLGGSATANVISTLAGVPLSWGLMFLVMMGGYLIDDALLVKWDSPAVVLAYVVLNAAWLAPYEEQLPWMIPMALAVLLIPSYFLSVWIEYLVGRRIWKEADRKSLWHTMRLANGVTYGILIFICMGLMLMSLK